MMADSKLVGIFEESAEFSRTERGLCKEAVTMLQKPAAAAVSFMVATGVVAKSMVVRGKKGCAIAVRQRESLRRPFVLDRKGFETKGVLNRPPLAAVEMVSIALVRPRLTLSAGVFRW